MNFESGTLVAYHPGIARFQRAFISFQQKPPMPLHEQRVRGAAVL
jgi:hypothetical protein